MEFNIRGTDETEIYISRDASILTKKPEAKLINGNNTHLQCFTFSEIYLVLIRSISGTIRIHNRINDSFIASYGLLYGNLKSETNSGEITLTHLTSGQHTLYYPSSVISSFSIEAPFQAFIIYFPESFFQRVLQDEKGISSFILKHIQKRKAFISSTMILTSSMHTIFDALINSNQQGAIKRISFEGKVLELLSAQLEQLEQSYKESSRSLFLKAHDIDKIYIAKNIIEQNIQTPCSLIELSRKVGLNDFKLKKGFKEILGTTVFTFLSDYRMERAKLLLNQKKSVGEVAYEVGYKNQHHFTAAFKKKYGILPSDLNR